MHEGCHDSHDTLQYALIKPCIFCDQEAVTYWIEYSGKRAHFKCVELLYGAMLAARSSTDPPNSNEEEKV